MTFVAIENQLIAATQFTLSVQPTIDMSKTSELGSVWRVTVLPPKIPDSGQSRASEAGGMRLRLDQPQSLQGPKQPVYWAMDIGFHCNVADNLTTVPLESPDLVLGNLNELLSDEAEAAAPIEFKPKTRAFRNEEVAQAEVQPETLSEQSARKEEVEQVALRGTRNAIARQNRMAAAVESVSEVHSSSEDSSSEDSIGESKIVENANAINSSAIAAGNSPVATKSQNSGTNVAKLAHAPNKASEKTRSADKTKPETATQKRVIKSADEYKTLLSEAAHDIRSPISTASQILRSVSDRARDNGELTPDEISLLDQANSRLVQANNWVEGILLDRRLMQGSPVPVRKRFYPMQWQSMIRPLLESIASRKSVGLSWLGWDRSLPKLYLDANHLSRVMMNLVSNAVDASPRGNRVSISVDWQKTIAQPIQISVADQAGGLSREVLQQLNRKMPVEDQPKKTPGLGLKTAKSLVHSMAGEISASPAPPAGSLIKVSLPIDRPQSLVRSWLTKNTLTKEFANTSELFVTIDVVRMTIMDFSFADSQMQLDAFDNELPYRVARDRWLWLALRSAKAATPYSLARTRDRLNDIGQRPKPVCNVRQVFKSREFDASELHGASMQQGKMLILLDSIIHRMNELIGDRIPEIDSLTSLDQSLLLTPRKAGQPGSFARVDKASTVQPNLPLLGRSRPRIEPSPELTQALAELAERWHQTQDKLERNLTHHNRTDGPELRPKAKQSRERKSRK